MLKVFKENRQLRKENEELRKAIKEALRDLQDTDLPIRVSRSCLPVSSWREH